MPYWQQEALAKSREKDRSWVENNTVISPLKVLSIFNT